MPELVISAIGRDRPGLVEEVSRCVLDAGLNVADSRMVNLRGRFALLLLGEGSAEHLAEARRALSALGVERDLQVAFGSEGGDAAPPAAGLAFRVETYSLDQPGIVHRTSQLLHRLGANIEELETRLESAPFSGDAVFRMRLRVTVPAGVGPQRLRSELAGLGTELSCDIDVEPA
ncbi:MAG: hypothetical protein IT376_05450 [Polyangiaceae bacterium]|nr:hypothetical protein [Polyangiaceae bacterium]